jgi:hypothetical protein
MNSGQGSLGDSASNDHPFSLTKQCQTAATPPP